MWIEQSKSKYRACARYKDPITGKRKKAGVTIKRNTPQERNKAARKLDELIAGKMHYPAPQMTLQRLVGLYLQYQKQMVKASTFARNESVCNQFMQMLGADTNVNALTAGYVKERFMMRTTNPTTINEYIGRFKALIRFGYQNDFVDNLGNIDRLKRLKDTTKKEKIKDKYLERSECKMLLESMNIEMWKNLTELLILTGCRIGEALALNEDDIDLTRRTITINKTINPTSKEITTPKTAASVRTIHMTPALVALTRAVLASNRRNRKLLYLDHTPLFFDLQGGYAGYEAYRMYLRRRSIQVLGRVITPHVLRHTHASLLAEQGLTIDEIKMQLGHDNSKVTEQIYVHITENRRQQLNNKLDAINII